MGTSGYCTTPAPGWALPNGVELTPYSQSIQVSIGTSIQTTLTITDATITLSGLPSGLSYSTNPSSGVINAGTDGCILISGTPALGSAGSFSGTLSVKTTSGMFLVLPLWWQLTIATGTSSIINHTENFNFFIAPNPALTELTISSTSHFKTVQIMDALGKIVLTHQVNYTPQTSINISSLNKGVYFLQVNDGAHLSTKKFIKE